ncbi:MAG: efflux RND transporter periplasmic adaptor subunit [Gammaproteobacteria bacterium]|nr:efflux RND transporter periplasmic adaptor subunit [Gammaproteobacteria bacterium]
MPSRATTRRIVLAVFALAVVLAGIGWATRPKAVRVAVASVQSGDVAATVSNTRAGTVDACNRARLAPPLGGQIARLPVRKGDAVKKGDVLLELWNDDVRAQVELQGRDRVAADARTREACATADVAVREAKRAARLLADRLISEEQAERAAGEAESRTAACSAARENARVADARVDVARANLERTILRAPFDGVIAEINGELGEFVTPSPVGVPTPPTVDVVDNSCLYISAPIDEVDAPAVRAGQRARITLDAFPGKQFPGFVRRVAPYVLDAEKQARTVEIEAEIENPQASNLLPGYSADVEVILDTRTGVLRVPTQAVIEGGRVLLLDEAAGVLRRRDVRIGVANWEHTEVVEGLQAGDLVVLSLDREGVVDGARAARELSAARP